MRAHPNPLATSTWLALALAIAALVVHVESVPAQSSDPGPTPAADSVGAVPLRDISDLLRSIIGRSVRTEVESEPRPGLSLTLLPSIGYNPSYGAFVGVSVSLAGWLGDRSTTSLSSGSVGASYSTTEQISVHFKSDFYLPDNDWAFKGDWRYLDTSQPTYGLGPAEGVRSEYPMDFVLYRLHQTVYRQVSLSNIYVGLGYHFDEYAEIHDTRAELGEPTPFTIYSGGTPTHTMSSGLSGNILVDTRDNAINARTGLFWNASLRSYLRAIGSDRDRQSLWSDFRAYVRSSPDSRNVLAIWNYMWFTFGEAPYLDLPAIGWDTYGRSGRGYLQGHIRGTDQAYVEFEYRRRFTRDDMWGGVAFLNLIATAGPSGSFGTFDPGYGAGVRVKFNKKTNTNLSVDAALGQDKTWRFFFGLQEVF